MGPGGGRLIVLVVLMTTEILSTPPLSVGDDTSQVQAGSFQDLGFRLNRLEANGAELRHQLQIKRCETGVMTFRPHTQPSVQWSDGTVRRTHSVHVHFSRPFATKPWVSVGITHLDVYNTANLRIDVAVDAISTSGFDARAYEWADTYTVLVNVSWVACNI